MSEQNRTLAKRWFEEVWNQRNVATVHELLTDCSACRSETGELKGAQAFLTQGYEPFIAAFPDLTIDVEGTVAEGDEVVVRWKATGTHHGPMGPLPPTGRRIEFRGMTWARIQDGKLFEGRDCWNMGALFQAIEAPGPRC